MRLLFVFVLVTVTVAPLAVFVLTQTLDQSQPQVGFYIAIASNSACLYCSDVLEPSIVTVKIIELTTFELILLPLLLLSERYTAISGL